MEIRLKKTLLVSGAALALLMAGGAAASTAHVHASTVKTNVPQRDYRQTGYREGNASSRHFYNDQAIDYSGKIAPYTASTFLKYQAPASNKGYESGYIKGYNKYANTKDGRHTFDHHYPNYTQSHYRYNEALHIYNRIRRYPRSYQNGYISGVTNQFADTGDFRIPKRYQNNVDYARGFLFMGGWTAHDAKGLNMLFGENQFSDYKGSGGKVMYRQLLSPHYQKLYREYWKMVMTEEHNAMTENQKHGYERYFYRTRKLSRNDKTVFSTFKEITYEGMGYNFYDGTGTGGYLWRGDGFARNQIRKSAFHTNVYYTPYVIDYTDGPLNKNTAFDGVILGWRGRNDTKVARQTANALKRYLVECDYSKHANKRVRKNFKKNYRIVNIAEAQWINGHKIDYSKGVSIYNVYNRHARNSTVTYYVPEGKGPFGQAPGMNG